VTVRPKKTALRALGEMCAAGGYLVEVVRNYWELPVHLCRLNLEGVFDRSNTFLTRAIDQLQRGGLVEEVRVRLFGKELTAVRVTQLGREVGEACKDGWFHREGTLRVLSMGGVEAVGLDGSFEVVQTQEAQNVRGV
jgi:hypothetical protein